MKSTIDAGHSTNPGVNLSAGTEVFHSFNSFGEIIALYCRVG